MRAVLENVGLRWLTGYGERPQRVIGWSVGTVAAWTGFYWLAQQSLDVLSGAGAVELLVFSVGSFATLLPTSPLTSGAGGDVGTQEAATVVQLLSEIEALLGVFMLAVFVFSLTRSLQR